MNYEKINKIMMSILEKKYEIKINAKVEKAGDTNEKGMDSRIQDGVTVL